MYIIRNEKQSYIYQLQIIWKIAQSFCIFRIYYRLWYSPLFSPTKILNLTSGLVRSWGGWDLGLFRLWRQNMNLGLNVTSLTHMNSMALLSMSFRSSVDRAPAMCSVVMGSIPVVTSHPLICYYILNINDILTGNFLTHRWSTERSRSKITLNY